MPADSSAVDDLLATVLNLTPVSFVNDPADAVGLKHPAAIVAFSTAPATSQPTTGPASQPAMTRVTFGGYDDVAEEERLRRPGRRHRREGGRLRRWTAVDKSPLDLRDKTVLDVDPARVTAVTVATNSGGTTKGATPAAAVVLTRRPPKPAMMGPSTHPDNGTDDRAGYHLAGRRHPG